MLKPPRGRRHRQALQRRESLSPCLGSGGAPRFAGASGWGILHSKIFELAFYVRLHPIPTAIPMLSQTPGVLNRSAIWDGLSKGL